MSKVEWTEIVHESCFCAVMRASTPGTLAVRLLRLSGGVVEVLDLGHAVAVGVVDERLLAGGAVLRQLVGCVSVFLRSGHGIASSIVCLLLARSMWGKRPLAQRVMAGCVGPTTVKRGALPAPKTTLFAELNGKLHRSIPC